MLLSCPCCCLVLCIFLSMLLSCPVYFIVNVVVLSCPANIIVVSMSCILPNLLCLSMPIGDTCINSFFSHDDHVFYSGYA